MRATPHIRLAAFVAVTAISTAGCGGGATHAIPGSGARPGGGANSASMARVTVRIVIPKTAAAKMRRARPLGTLHPNYVSSGVGALLIENATSTQQIALFDVSSPGAPGSPCSAPASDGSITCTSAAVFAVGTAVYTFYELQNATISNNLIAGVLAASRFAVTIAPPGQPNVVDATLGGVPASVSLAFPALPPKGIPVTVPLVATVRDASSAIIVGSDPFVDANANPAKVTLTDLNPSPATGLVLDGTGSPAASVALSAPNQTVAFAYDGTIAKAQIVASVSANQTNNAVVFFTPGLFPATFHTTADSSAGRIGIAPLIDGSAAVAIAETNASGPPFLSTLDAGLNLISGRYAFDTTFPASDGILALYGSLPSPSAGYTAYGHSALATYDVATGATTTTPYVIPPASTFDISGSIRTGTRSADGTVWFTQYSSFYNPQSLGQLSFVRPNGSVGTVPANARLDYVCSVGASHVVALADKDLAGNFGVPETESLIVDTATAAGMSATPLFPAGELDVPLGCSESFDGKSIWILESRNSGSLHLLHDTFDDPDTLAGIHVNDGGVFGDGTLQQAESIQKFVPGDDAAGDTALYGRQIIAPTAIARFDTSTLSVTIYHTPDASNIVDYVRGNDQNIWLTTDSGLDGYLQVHS